MKASLHVKKKTLWVMAVPDVSSSENKELICPLEGKEVEKLDIELKHHKFKHIFQAKPLIA